jgi:hypothetical protein
VNHDFKDISVITDIAANTFAVFLLILLLLLAVRLDPPDAQVNKTALDVEADLASVERKPLRPEDIVDMLYDRRSAARGTRVDLFDDRVEVLDPSGQRQITAGAPDLKGAIAVGAPVSLYVFDHRSYAAVTNSLLAARTAWRELSVPQALRQLDPASGRQAWSAGFVQLLAQPLDRASFRLELAKLLGAAQPTGQEGAGAGRGAFSAPDQSALALAGRFARWWRAVVAVATTLAGLLFVLVVETRSRPARPEDVHMDRTHSV